MSESTSESTSRVDWLCEETGGGANIPGTGGNYEEAGGGASLPGTGGNLDDLIGSMNLTGITSDWFKNNSTIADYYRRTSESVQPDAKTVDNPADKKPGGGSSESLLDKIGKFVEKNKGLTEILAKGVYGAAAGVAAGNQAKALARSRTEELREADRIKQADNARISASVSGLREPGIIGRQRALKRVDGTPVFTNGKIGG